MMAVLHIDKIVLQGLADCVEPGGKFAGLVKSMANVGKSADKRQAKRGLTADGCMQLGAEVSHLVRLIALAQPKAAGTADVYTLMTVNKWAEVCSISHSSHSFGVTRWVQNASIFWQQCYRALPGPAGMSQRDGGAAANNDCATTHDRAVDVLGSNMPSRH
jgi:hypothetical protein